MTLQPRPQQNLVDISGRLRSTVKQYRGLLRPPDIGIDWTEHIRCSPELASEKGSE
jgi:hypothetical protein